VSAAVLSHLSCRSPRRYYVPVEAPVGDSHPYGLDLQLALFICTNCRSDTPIGGSYPRAQPNLRSGARPGGCTGVGIVGLRATIRFVDGSCVVSSRRSPAWWMVRRPSGPSRSV
jgi:hypothetical protein